LHKKLIYFFPEFEIQRENYDKIETFVPQDVDT